MKILVLGGDGYCGWPTALYLSHCGHDIGIVDSFHRRLWDHELGAQTLTPIRPLPDRLRVWSRVHGEEIESFVGDITDYEFVSTVVQRFEPEAIVHFAEQRSAPYSMIDRRHAVFSQVNNVVGTLNVLFAIREFLPDCHLIKLGDRKSTRLNSSHSQISYAVFCLKKKKKLVELLSDFLGFWRRQAARSHLDVGRILPSWVACATLRVGYAACTGQFWSAGVLRGAL